MMSAESALDVRLSGKGCENDSHSHSAEQRRRLAKTARRRLLRTIATALLASVVIFSMATTGVAAQTSASLNKPDATTAVVTSTAGGANPTQSGPASSSVDRPTSTSIAPIGLSTQQVPFLLGSPAKQAKNLSINAGGAVRGPSFVGCNDAGSTAQYAVGAARINVSAVYTQFDASPRDSALGSQDPYSKGTLRIVGIGTVGNESHAFGTSTNSAGQVTGLLSAVQVSSSFLTFPVFDNYTYLCDRMYPVGNDTLYPNVNPPSCQYGPGTVAFGIDVPLNQSYDLGTIWTQIRLTDPSTPPLTLACIEVQASPYDPDEWYWDMIFYVPIAIVAALMVLITLALLITAETNMRMAYKNRAREGGAPSFFKDTVRPMMISALGGKEQINSPPLLRFITPGCWDVIWHMQFLIAIAMCHVQWPDFVYPFFRQVAWSSLIGNVTIVESANETRGLLHTNASLPDGDIGAQMNNASSPLYMNASQPNTLLNLGTGADGIRTFAAAIGLQPGSLFGTCLIIWLAIVAIVLAASAIGWLIDLSFESYYRHQYRKAEASGEIVGSWSSEAKRSMQVSPDGSTQPLTGVVGARFRGHFGSHSRALHGNVVRALALFHLPITIVSTFQLAAASEHSKISVGLAAFAFAVLSVIAPIYLVWRLAQLPGKELYESTHTLLSLGSVYHMFAPGSQLFISVVFAHHLILGIVVGAGQNSGAVQAIIILILEIASALIWSLWLPWGDGSMMGPVTFLTGILRITTAVLVLLLTSIVGLSKEARGWLAYVILLIQGIYFVALLLMVAVKVLEALVRVFWRLRFDEKTSGRTAGLGGAIRKIKRRKYKMQRSAKASRKIQLKSIRPGAHRRSGSVGTMSSLNIYEKTGAQQGAMTDAQRAAYANYLEKGNGTARRPERPLSGSDFDYFYDAHGQQTSRPPSTLLPFGRAGDQDENGAIMAAMPPLTPLAYDKLDQRPYGRGDKGAQAVSPGYHQSGTVSPDASAWAYGGKGYQPVRRRASNDAMSSTQLAARSARQSLLDQPLHNRGPASAPQKAPGFRERLLRAWGKSNAASSDEDSDDDADEEYEDGKPSRQSSRKGLGFFGAALGGVRNVRRGLGNPSRSASQGDHLMGADEEAPTVRGFEVVRPNRSKPQEQGGVGDEGGGPTRGFEVIRPGHTKQSSNGDAVRDSSPEQHDLTPSQAQVQYDTHAPEERSAQDFYTMRPSAPQQQQSQYQQQPQHHHHAYQQSQQQPQRQQQQHAHGRPEQEQRSSEVDLQQRPLGMLGADLQRGPSSAGHTAEGGATAGEEQFWLPPLDLHSDNTHESAERGK